MFRKELLVVILPDLTSIGWSVDLTRETKCKSDVNAGLPVWDFIGFNQSDDIQPTAPIRLKCFGIHRKAAGDNTIFIRGQQRDQKV